jgi:hypothetical protein
VEFSPSLKTRILTEKEKSRQNQIIVEVLEFLDSLINIWPDSSLAKCSPPAMLEARVQSSAERSLSGVSL